MQNIREIEERPFSHFNMRRKLFSHYSGAVWKEFVKKAIFPTKTL